MQISQTERAALRRAFVLAATDGVPLGPNPRVGCVLLDPTGAEVAEGFHRGAGSAHAEVAALQSAAALGATPVTAVVTLEPCAHIGRTGPCVDALIRAGIARVVYAAADPNPVAAGGAAALRAAGVDVVGPVDAERHHQLNRAWSFAISARRPFVTWKFAATLDGRSAAADGTSRWVSSRAARVDTHRLRALCDTMLVGSNTVAVDNPEMTVRDEFDEPVAHQPLRAVMGLRDLAPDRLIFNARAETVRLRTRDVDVALAELNRLDRKHVFLEGGPTLAAAFLKAGRVDEVVTYLAPKVLGSGASAVADLGIGTIDAALDFEIVEVTTVGGGDETNVRITMRPRVQRPEGRG